MKKHRTGRVSLPIAKLTATLALATTLTFTACEEKKKQDGTTPAPTEPAAAAETQQPTQEAAAVAEKAAEVVKGSFTDSRDKKTYKTIKIGTQTWMAENLNYEAKGSKCNGEGGEVVLGGDDDGNAITTTLSEAEIQANCTKYGRLYNWVTAKAACPSGWHLPNDVDWNVLMKFVNPSCSDNKNCEGAGTKLKATSGWDDNDEEGKSGNGTDNFGFSALPAGTGISDGSFGSVGAIGNWWSSSEYKAYDGAYRLSMNFSGEDVYYGDISKGFLLSVRCIMD